MYFYEGGVTLYRKFYPQYRKSSGLGAFIIGLGIGVLLGALAGVLSAPHRGDVTRRRLSKKAESTRDQIVEAVEDFVDGDASDGSIETKAAP
jgi:gas vesicle protein